MPGWEDFKLPPEIRFRLEDAMRTGQTLPENCTKQPHKETKMTYSVDYIGDLKHHVEKATPVLFRSTTKTPEGRYASVICAVPLAFQYYGDTRLITVTCRNRETPIVVECPGGV